MITKSRSRSPEMYAESSKSRKDPKTKTEQSSVQSKTRAMKQKNQQSENSEIKANSVQDRMKKARSINNVNPGSNSFSQSAPQHDILEIYAKVQAELKSKFDAPDQFSTVFEI